jgi:hypothetical protein
MCQDRGDYLPVVSFDGEIKKSVVQVSSNGSSRKKRNSPMKVTHTIQRRVPDS